MRSVYLFEIFFMDHLVKYRISSFAIDTVTLLMLY
jgi:hypothetical protein